MENHTIYLPLYEEPSTHFKNFVSKMQGSSYLPNYLALFSQNRLTFFPSVATDEESPLRKASTAIPTTSTKREKEVSKFVTQFNMLSSISSGRHSGKCTLDISFSEMPEKFPKSTNVLVVSLSTNDLAVSMAIDNLFKVL